jgi:universal stress protein E
MKLLRRCPVPVLVTKVGTNVRPLNILAATDLKPAGQCAMELAVRLAQQLDAHLHVLHVVEYPLDRIWSTGLAESPESVYHKRVRQDAEQRLQAQLKMTDAAALGERLHLHLTDGVAIADVAIQNSIDLYNIHLLVMGTIGRAGIPGIMIGNTAERVLPEVHCSVLGVKPPDFQSPITLK